MPRRVDDAYILLRNISGGFFPADKASLLVALRNAYRNPQYTLPKFFEASAGRGRQSRFKINNPGMLFGGLRIVVRYMPWRYAWGHVAHVPCFAHVVLCVHEFLPWHVCGM